MFLFMVKELMNKFKQLTVNSIQLFLNYQAFKNYKITFAKD